MVLRSDYVSKFIKMILIGQLHSAACFVTEYAAKILNHDNLAGKTSRIEKQITIMYGLQGLII